MTSDAGENRAFQGKTYSLFREGEHAEHYYDLIRKITDTLLERCPDEQRLLYMVQNAYAGIVFKRRLRGKDVDKRLVSYIRKTLRESLSVYTTGVRKHLRTLPLRQRFDAILRTKEEQYHLYMIEIELSNRVFREAFRRSRYRFALIAHCLRDFRPGCKAESGEYEDVCRGCSNECLIHLGSVLLKKYDIHPYISVTLDLEKLFRRIKSEHRSVGALGIACVPELAMGIRLCSKIDIPSIGIPLDANRCARWMKKAHETSFSLKELEKLLA